MPIPTVPWSAADDRKLSFHWGSTPLAKIETLLGRTRIALIRRAAHLQLGGLGRGKKTIGAFCASTGYARSTILGIASTLGMKFRHMDRGDVPYTERSPRRILISADQEERIIAYLKEHREFKRHFPPGAKKSQKGVWGVGLKPAQCLRCQRDDKKHYAKGLCKPCYKYRSELEADHLRTARAA